jgi:hypothetical protein
MNVTIPPVPLWPGQAEKLAELAELGRAEPEPLVGFTYAKDGFRALCRRCGAELAALCNLVVAGEEVCSAIQVWEPFRGAAVAVDAETGATLRPHRYDVTPKGHLAGKPSDRMVRARLGLLIEPELWDQPIGLTCGEHGERRRVDAAELRREGVRPVRV